MGNGAIGPLFNSVKTFFSNWLRLPSFRAATTMDDTPANTETTSEKSSPTVEKRKCTSAPNIYMTSSMDIMSNNRNDNSGRQHGKQCSFDKSGSLVADYEILAQLSASTKSFSDYSLPIKCNSTTTTADSTTTGNSAPTTGDDIVSTTRIADVDGVKTTAASPNTTKETSEVLAVPLPTTTAAATVKATPTTNSGQILPNVQIKPRAKKRSSKEKGASSSTSNNKKSKTKSAAPKNRKEKGRHELALKIHEDTEEVETMSADEWDNEPLVIITKLSPPLSSSVETTASDIATAATTTTTASSPVSFSTVDFPAMPTPSSSVPVPPICTAAFQTWELPRLSHSIAGALNDRSQQWQHQRRPSECDSEDSFIVFDNGNDTDNKFAPSSVESNQSSINERIRNRLSIGRQRQVSESSEDDFIYFEMDDDELEGHCDNDDDDDDEETADCDDDDDDDEDDDDDDEHPPPSDCESEVEVKLSGNTPPDSGFEEKERKKEKEKEKKVRFNPTPIVHVMRTWTFAYNQARKGEWEQNGRDRVRFHDRIKRLEATLSPIFDTDHRQKVYSDRFRMTHGNNNADKSASVAGGNLSDCSDVNNVKNDVDVDGPNGKINE